MAISPRESTCTSASLEEEAVGIALVLHSKDGEKISKYEYHKSKPNHRRHCRMALLGRWTLMNEWIGATLPFWIPNSSIKLNLSFMSIMPKEMRPSVNFRVKVHNIVLCYIYAGKIGYLAKLLRIQRTATMYVSAMNWYWLVPLK